MVSIVRTCVNMVENLCSADPMLCDSPTATNDGVYNIYSLNNIPDAENNLSFMSDGDKESSDLFYGWGDMGNFEDGDNMLRNCDSTFGLDSTNNEDDMCWFSSSQPNDNTEDIKPDMMFGNQRTPMLQVEDFLNNSESNYAVEDENGYTIMGGSAQENSSENVYDTSLLEKDILMLDEEVNFVEQQRHNCMNPNGGTKEMKGAAGSHLETGETDKYVGFMDIETDTDPIDRSIAHLLFHRPSDASLSSDRDVLSYKTHQMIPHPNSSPSLRIEKEEETREQLGTEAEGVASIHVRNKSPDSNTWLPL
ncbi:BnaC02g48860D [Brassica napus]|uniref:BnaC02g48860D protein n=1 Tax=Brassica napus TaxID=3708 RepID=A0A078JEM9_BRANA|nr:BnaC02g48860D [Brassica napus]